MSDPGMSDPLSIKGWTREDKYDLLQAFKAYGIDDIQKIREYLPEKTPMEIKNAIDMYKKVAEQHPLLQKIKTKSERKHSEPLTAWAKLLRDNIPLKELTTETATAVRMIAELENIPDPHLTENIDFRKIYHTIANAMEGKPLEADKMTIAVLHKCMTETAILSKSFMKTKTLKEVLGNIEFGEKDEIKSITPPDNQALALLRTLAEQKSINPLQIPEQYLKPSVSEAQPHAAMNDKPEKPKTTE